MRCIIHSVCKVAGLTVLAWMDAKENPDAHKRAFSSKVHTCNFIVSVSFSLSARSSVPCIKLVVRNCIENVPAKSIIRLY